MEQNQHQTRTRIVQFLSIFLSLILFYVALWVLHKQIKSSHLHDVLAYLKDIQPQRFLTAFGLALLSYVALTGYDALGLRHVRKSMSYAKIALTSFISYSLSHNIGAAPLTGGGIRYRFYSAWGLGAGETATVLVICGMTYWVGFLTMGSIFFFLEPPQLPPSLHIPFNSVFSVGFICLLVVTAYLLSCVLIKGSLRIVRWVFPMPSVGIALGQMAVGCLDWTCSGLALFLLLPPSPLTFPSFMAIYLLAQVAGFASQVPGGLGVLELVVVTLLAPDPSARPAILGALLAFRVAYYLIPFVLGVVFFATLEAYRNKEGFKRSLQILNRFMPDFAPHLFAVLAFASGALLLFSNAEPETSRRLIWLNEFMPLYLLEGSHLLAGLAGAGLLVLARGLQQRLDGAYLLSLVLLGGGTLCALFKGFDYEAALPLLAVFGVLLPCGRYFPKKASLFRQKYPPAWVAAVMFVLLGSVWLGLFNYRYEDYSNGLWMTFDIVDDLARFLRSTLGSALVLALFSLVSLLSPVQPETEIPGLPELARALAGIKNSKTTYAFLALLDDKALLLSRSGSAFIMYGIEGKSWVAVGDPVGPGREHKELVEEFQEQCRKEESWVIFYQTSRETSQLYLDLGLTVTKFCEEARVALGGFSLDHGVSGELKGVLQKFREKRDYSFEILPPERAEALFPALKKVSEEWLSKKKTREKGFTVGFFHEEYLRRFPVAVVRKEGQITAFANLWQAGGQEEISVDLLRSSEEAPPRVEDYLLLELMFWARERGFKWFNLGAAPLLDAQETPLAPFKDKIAEILSPYEPASSLEESRKEKDKFNPEWRPKYLVMSADLALPVVLNNIQSLVSKGTRPVFKKIQS